MLKRPLNYTLSELMPVPYTRKNQIRLRALYLDLKEVDDRQVQTQALSTHVKRLVKLKQAAVKPMSPS